MYKIHPIEETIIAKSIYPDLGENELLFAVNEEGKFTGTGICEIKDGKISIKVIDAPYDDARTLMFLSMLSYAEKRGIKEGVCLNEGLKDLCARYGFDENLKVNLEGFFKAGAHCIH